MVYSILLYNNNAQIDCINLVIVIYTVGFAKTTSTFRCSCRITAHNASDNAVRISEFLNVSCTSYCCCLRFNLCDFVSQYGYLHFPLSCQLYLKQQV